MEWLKNLIKSNPFTSLFIPTTLGGMSFIVNLSIALSDGKIDSNEFHQLMSSSSGLQTVILVIIMAALKRENK